ncbi:hypothetical protein TrRE_jg4585 [Triparma retinervis]|uniref:Uncharacterized protein n=1 Tax=Triparma retinervis TaxID=2557542 RepID=A0A9W7E4L8_9STRA|nr:hypothetical protein TrRE_jg4585 [Triparma retinervis]
MSSQRKKRKVLDDGYNNDENSTKQTELNTLLKDYERWQPPPHDLEVGQRAVHRDWGCPVVVTALAPNSVSIAYEGGWVGWKEKIPLDELEEKLQWRPKRQESDMARHTARPPALRGLMVGSRVMATSRITLIHECGEGRQHLQRQRLGVQDVDEAHPIGELVPLSPQGRTARDKVKSRRLSTRILFSCALFDTSRLGRYLAAAVFLIRHKSKHWPKSRFILHVETSIASVVSAAIAEGCDLDGNSRVRIVLYTLTPHPGRGPSAAFVLASLRLESLWLHSEPGEVAVVLDVHDDSEIQDQEITRILELCEREHKPLGMTVWEASGDAKECATGVGGGGAGLLPWGSLPVGEGKEPIHVHLDAGLLLWRGDQAGVAARRRVSKVIKSSSGAAGSGPQDASAFRDFVTTSLFECSKVPRGADEVLLERFLGSDPTLLRKSACYTIHRHKFGAIYMSGDEVDLEALRKPKKKKKKNNKKTNLSSSSTSQLVKVESPIEVDLGKPERNKIPLEPCTECQNAK